MADTTIPPTAEQQQRAKWDLLLSNPKVRGELASMKTRLVVLSWIAVVTNLALVTSALLALIHG